jgi:glutaredoxin
VRESTEGSADPDIVVYSRQDCCLCDDALAQIEAARSSVPFSLRVVDVDDDPALAEKYGHEVPVVEIDGRKAFKYRLTTRELLRRLRSRRSLF